MKYYLIFSSLFFYLFFICIFLFCKYLQGKIKKALNCIECYTFDSFQEVFMSSARFVSCSLVCGKYWCYDLKKNVVYIPSKKRYSLYDKFVLLHETGHFIDSKTKCRTAYKVDFIFRIINIVSFFPIILISVLLLKNTQCQARWVLPVLCFFYLFILLIEFCLTIWLETRASRFALSCVNADTNKKKLCKLAFWAMLDQLIIKIMWAFPMCELIIAFTKG